MVSPGGWGPARRGRWAISAHLLVMGLTSGVWMARVPAAKAQAHLSDGTLGIALFAVPVGLVLGAALAERLVDRVGSRILVRICGVGSCVAVAGPGLAGNLPALMAALFVIGVVGGTLDVSSNAQGVRVEAGYGRPVMTSMHAFYSLGAILGSLAGGGFAWAGVALLPSLAAVGAVGAVIDGAAGRWLLSEAGQPPGTRDSAALGLPTAGLPTAGLPTARQPASSVTPVPRDERRVRRLVLALGVLGVCGLVGEGAAGDWSAVYLRDNLGTSAGFAAVGFAAFSAAMTTGRASGDRLIRRFGVVRVIRACGALAAAGLAVALATPSPAASVAGLTAFGAGLSIVVPQVFAAGGRADPARPGSGLARVVGLGYAGMAAGPAVIGLVAGRIGLRLALAIPVLLALWIAIAARALTPAGEPSGGAGQRGTVRETDPRPRSRAGHCTEYRYDMDDRQILARISSLIETEHQLRGELAEGRLSSEQERERLRSAEEALDQCWDLLRQRRARRDAGDNPDAAAVRAAAEVEGYQQLSSCWGREAVVLGPRALHHGPSGEVGSVGTSERRRTVRIARFAKGDGVAYGVVEGESGQAQTIAELHGHPFGIDPAGVRYTGNRFPLAEVRLLAPVLPSKVVAVGKNYAEHVKEMRELSGEGELPAEPVLFLKPSTSVTGHGDRIAYPVKLTDRVDYEGELAVIIGRLCRDVPKERAADVIFGYTCANDVTARDLQFKDGQWTRAKGFDTFCPLGPWMETGLDPADLGLTTTVNGAVKQHARTSELLWDVPSLIEFVSSVMTLLPGDVLLTGTPEGVGPLTDGDEVSVTIESIGTLTNRVVIRDLPRPAATPAAGPGELINYQ